MLSGLFLGTFLMLPGVPSPGCPLWSLCPFPKCPSLSLLFCMVGTKSFHAAFLGQIEPGPSWRALIDGDSP